MPLGTLDRTPPPFFRQGPSALTRLTIFSALALFLMVADTRFEITRPLRAAIATVLHPIERMLLVPVAAWEGGSDYLMGLQHALAKEEEAKVRLARQAERAARVEQLQAENDRLRTPMSVATCRSAAASPACKASRMASKKSWSTVPSIPRTCCSSTLPAPWAMA